MNYNTQKDLPLWWQKCIQYLTSYATKAERYELECGDFNLRLHLETQWGSLYTFERALFLKSSTEILVATEHDGYFIFKLEDVIIRGMTIVGDSPLKNFINKKLSANNSIINPEAKEY